MTVSKWKNGVAPMDGKKYKVIAGRDVRITYQGYAYWGLFINSQLPDNQAKYYCWIGESGIPIAGKIQKWLPFKTHSVRQNKYQLAF